MFSDDNWLAFLHQDTELRTVDSSHAVGIATKKQLAAMTHFFQERSNFSPILTIGTGGM